MIVSSMSIRKIIFLPLLSFMISCSNEASTCERSGDTLIFRKSGYGTQWPFSINEIEVYCAGYKEIYCRAENGKTYPLNGSAKDASKNNPSITEVDEIWLENPDLPGTKIPYAQFIQEGLKLCNDK